MADLFKVLALSGSTRQDSVNELLLNILLQETTGSWDLEDWKGIDHLPFFNQDLDKDEPPAIVREFREKIAAADGVLICTPEYVFSLPGILKNAIEWTVSTTLFSEKPVALITASSSGEKAHASLLLIFRTIYAMVEEPATLLIGGAKAKVKANKQMSDPDTMTQLFDLVKHFTQMMSDKRGAGIKM